MAKEQASLHLDDQQLAAIEDYQERESVTKSEAARKLIDRGAGNHRDTFAWLALELAKACFYLGVAFLGVWRLTGEFAAIWITFVVAMAAFLILERYTPTITRALGIGGTEVSG